MARGFLLIVGDDFGIEQFSTYNAGGNTGAGGMPYPQTTNISAMASNGWRAAAGCYSQLLCCPARATLLTATYPFRHGVGDLIRDDFSGPGTQLALPHSFTTLPELLLANGYRTACFGKWHLSNAVHGGKLGPNQHGFELYAGNLFNMSASAPTDPATALLGFTSGPTYYDHILVRNGETTRCAQFNTTYLANLAIDWIRARQAANEDWFLYLPFYGAHTPYATPPATHFQTGLWGAAPYGAAGVPTVTAAKFKAMIESVDFEVGRVLSSLNYTNDTVFFVTDNGTGSTTLDDGTGTFFEAHPTNSPAPYIQFYTRPSDSLREYRGKDSPFQSGILVPLIARGAGITVPADTASAGLFSMADIYPTIAALAGITMPSQACDGVSFKGLLDGGSYTPRTYVYTEGFFTNGPNTGSTLGNRAITDGTYKLIRGINDGSSGASQYPDSQTATGSARLYKLTDDWRETNNLTANGLGTDLVGADKTAFDALDAAMAALLAS